jgi:hypothetical protein
MPPTRQLLLPCRHPDAAQANGEVATLSGARKGAYDLLAGRLHLFAQKTNIVNLLFI